MEFEWTSIHFQLISMEFECILNAFWKAAPLILLGFLMDFNTFSIDFERNLNA